MLVRDGQSHEIGGLVGRELAADHGQAELLRLLGELIGQPLAKGRTVVDHADLLDLEHVGRITGHVGAGLLIAGHDAKQVLVAALGDLGVGAHGGDHGAAVVIDARCRNGHARAVRPHDIAHARIHKLLRHGHAGLGVALVVLGHQLELQRLATHVDLARVQVLDGQAHAVVVVAAGEGVRARQGAAVADLDDLLLGQGARGANQGGSGHEGGFHDGGLHGEHSG